MLMVEVEEAVQKLAQVGLEFGQALMTTICSTSSVAASSSYNNLNNVNVGVVLFTAVAGVAVGAIIYSNRGSLTPRFFRKKHRPLSPQQWSGAFTSEGRLIDGGLTILRVVRNGGIDPTIRAEVWPFLLGVYDLNSTKQERELERASRRKEYERLRKECKYLQKEQEKSNENDEMAKGNKVETGKVHGDNISADSDDSAEASRDSILESSITDNEEKISNHTSTSEILEKNDFSDGEVISKHDAQSPVASMATKQSDTVDNAKEQCDYVSDSESLVEDDFSLVRNPATEYVKQAEENSSPDIHKLDGIEKLKARGPQGLEDYSTWQRIIRLDAVRMNDEWVPYSSQTRVSEEESLALARRVGLKNDENLEPCRRYHAARLVAILEAYALLDPEIGYCQGMSDLLSPFVALMEEDFEAFWCFVHFMHFARHNFRLDEVGIRRQLSMVAKIVKTRDPSLYEHLEKLEAEDFFFVYRMVVVLFRRELTFEQTLYLWEVIWANQAVIRSGLGKAACRRGKLNAPPTSDLLLYAIAALVLQKRKVIIDNYQEFDEILRECNSMAGHLDVWKLIDEAYDLVIFVQGKI